MDIYFCDLCGARVSDIDLRGGHGIRKQYDVICANCLELGHGKEWLAKHQRGRPASAAGAVKAPAPAVRILAAAATASPTIDAARDRVRTLEEGDMTPAVPAQVISAHDAVEEDVAPGELEAEEATSDDTPVPAASSFAAAASSFSALGAPQAKSRSATHDDDLTDSANGSAAEAGSDHQRIVESASPFELDAKAENDLDQAREEAETDDGHGGRRGRDVSQKDETIPLDRPLVVAPEERSLSGRKSSSSSSAGKKSAAKTSKNGISPAGKSGRNRAKNKNKNIFIMTGLSIGILTMIMLILMPTVTKKDRIITKLELSEEVKHGISEARVDADSSLRTKTLKDMEAAKAKILAISSKIRQWEVEADKQKWTDEQKGDYMEKIGWPATNSRMRLLNDEIVKAGGH